MHQKFSRAISSTVTHGLSDVFRDVECCCLFPRLARSPADLEKRLKAEMGRQRAGRSRAEMDRGSLACMFCKSCKSGKRSSRTRRQRLAADREPRSERERYSPEQQVHDTPEHVNKITTDEVEVTLPKITSPIKSLSPLAKKPTLFSRARFNFLLAKHFFTFTHLWLMFVKRHPCSSSLVVEELQEVYRFVR